MFIAHILNICQASKGRGSGNSGSRLRLLLRGLAGLPVVALLLGPRGRKKADVGFVSAVDRWFNPDGRDNVEWTGDEYSCPEDEPYFEEEKNADPIDPTQYSTLRKKKCD